MMVRWGFSAHSVSTLHTPNYQCNGSSLTRRFVQSDGMGGESYSSSSSSLSNESGSRRKEPGFSTCKCADKVDDSRLKRSVAAAPWFLRSSSRPLDMGDVATVPLDGGRGDVVSMGEAPADA